MRVPRSSRVLYVNGSRESRRAVKFLEDLGVHFCVVQVRNWKKDPRNFLKIPALSFVSRGGYIFDLFGLDQIKRASAAIVSDFLTEQREAEAGSDEGPGSSEQVALDARRRLADAARL